MTGEFVGRVGFIVICLISAVLLKNFGFKGVPVLISVVLVGVCALYAESLGGLFSGLYGLVGDGAEEYISSGIRILGVGYLSGVVADICRELGEGGLASSAVLIGRLEILLICMPYFEKIIRFASEGV